MRRNYRARVGRRALYEAQGVSINSNPINDRDVPGIDRDPSDVIVNRQKFQPLPTTEEPHCFRHYWHSVGKISTKIQLQPLVDDIITQHQRLEFAYDFIFLEETNFMDSNRECWEAEVGLIENAGYTAKHFMGNGNSKLFFHRNDLDFVYNEDSDSGDDEEAGANDVFTMKLENLQFDMKLQFQYIRRASSGRGMSGRNRVIRTLGKKRSEILFEDCNRNGIDCICLADSNSPFIAISQRPSDDFNEKGYLIFKSDESYIDTPLNVIKGSSLACNEANEYGNIIDRVNVNCMPRFFAAAANHAGHRIMGGRPQDQHIPLVVFHMPYMENFQHEPVKCNGCARLFTDDEALRYHQTDPRPERKDANYVCMECEGEPHNQLEFFWHMLYEEEVCPTCNAKVTAGSVKTHMRTMHPEIEFFKTPESSGAPRKCNFCKRWFCSLELHQKLYRHLPGLNDAKKIGKFQRLMDGVMENKVGPFSVCRNDGCHYKGTNSLQHTYMTGHTVFKVSSTVLDRYERNKSPSDFQLTTFSDSEDDEPQHEMVATVGHSSRLNPSMATNILENNMLEEERIQATQALFNQYRSPSPQNQISSGTESDGTRSASPATQQNLRILPSSPGTSRQSRKTTSRSRFQQKRSRSRSVLLDRNDIDNKSRLGRLDLSDTEIESMLKKPRSILLQKLNKLMVAEEIIWSEIEQIAHILFVSIQIDLAPEPVSQEASDTVLQLYKTSYEKHNDENVTKMHACMAELNNYDWTLAAIFESMVHDGQQQVYIEDGTSPKRWKKVIEHHLRKLNGVYDETNKSGAYNIGIICANMSALYLNLSNSYEAKPTLGETNTAKQLIESLSWKIRMCGVARILDLANCTRQYSKKIVSLIVDIDEIIAENWPTIVKALENQ